MARNHKNSLQQTKSKLTKEEKIQSSNSLAEEHNFINQPKEQMIRVCGNYVFKEGETFRSFDEVLDRMAKHQQESHVFYWRRDSRTIERAYTKTTRSIATKLKYYTVRYSCVFGGQKFQPRGEGKRNQQRISKRVDCPANIFFRAAKCGELLEVASVCNTHNHEISEKMSKLLPQNRRLSKCLRDEVVELLKLNIERNKIMAYVKAREQKNITSKDLFNLAARLKGAGVKINVSNDRISILKRICEYDWDSPIKQILIDELGAFDKTNEYLSVDDEMPIVEFISPEHEFGVNETIIESIVKAQKEETNYATKNKMIGIIESNLCNRTDIMPKNFIQIYGHFDYETHENKFNDQMNLEHQIPQQLSEGIEIDVKNDMVDDQNKCSMIVFEENLSNEELINEITINGVSETNNIRDKETESDMEIIEYDNVEYFNEIESHSDEILDNSYPDNGALILYETTTENIIENIEANKRIPESSDENLLCVLNYEEIAENIPTEMCQQLNKKSRNNNQTKRSVLMSRQRMLNCRKCGTNGRLINMQIKYLKAERDRLLEETKLLKAKRKALQIK